MHIVCQLLSKKKGEIHIFFSKETLKSAVESLGKDRHFSKDAF